MENTVSLRMKRGAVAPAWRVQQVGQVVQVQVAVALLAGAGQAAALVHAGVVEPVGEDQGLGSQGLAVQQGGQHRGVGPKSPSPRIRAAWEPFSPARRASRAAWASRVPQMSREEPAPAP